MPGCFRSLSTLSGIKGVVFKDDLDEKRLTPPPENLIKLEHVARAKPVAFRLKGGPTTHSSLPESRCCSSRLKR